MKPLLTNEQKMNDIIFANRNKSYGAYAIRSSYDQTVLKSLLILVSMVLLVFGSAYIYTKAHEKIETKIDASNILPIIKTVEMDLKKLDKPKPLDPTPKNNNSGGPKTNGFKPLVVDSAQTVSTQSVDINPNSNSNPDLNPDPNGTGTGNNSTGTNTLTEISNEPVLIADVSPEFEGGLAALSRFIAQNISYPELAKEMGKEGKVYISFVVDEKGQVERVKVARGIGGGCDEEAIRVVSMLPKFKSPGKMNGRAVKVLFNLPIVFKLK